MQSNIKAVIFDLDGTLYASPRYPLYLIAGDPLHALILQSERKCRKKLQGKDFESADAYYAALFGLIAEDRKTSVQKAERWFWHNYMPTMERVVRSRYKAQPKAAELLAYLRAKGIKVAVLSDYAFAEQKLQAIGLGAENFDGVYESPATGGLKPCKASFLNVCKALEVEPCDTLFVGDRVNTDGGSMAAGLQFIHLASKPEKKETAGNGFASCLWSELLCELGFTE